MIRFFREFRDFAARGNVLDLAIGVIIGNAFNQIVSSLVKDILMPLLSVFIGRVNIQKLTFVINARFLKMDKITITYGAFLQNVLDFLCVTFCIFLIVKLLNRLHLHQPAAKKEQQPQQPSQTDALLTEIRDLLRTGATLSEAHNQLEKHHPDNAGDAQHE